jgi:hypothetical protein
MWSQRSNLADSFALKNLFEKGLKASSLTPLLRRILEEAGIYAQTYSSHSMRRDFVTWASANGWDFKGFTGFVGWKQIKSALSYIDASNAFGGLTANNTSQIGRDWWGWSHLERLNLSRSQLGYHS